jgi:hypothetical protein
LVDKVSSLTDRLLARFVPGVDAAASGAGTLEPVCGWVGCGYECLIKDFCCDSTGCHYSICYWAC